MEMLKQKVTVKNQTGLHLRPAGILCRTAMLYKSHISLKHGDTTANAKSVLSVLGACVKCGDEIELSCDGPLREPYIAYQQGSLTYNYGKIAVMKAVSLLLNSEE